MKHNEISAAIVDHSVKIHKALGPGLLKFTELRLGLLINFGAPLLKDGIHRIANGLDKKKGHPGENSM